MESQNQMTSIPSLPLYVCQDGPDKQKTNATTPHSNAPNSKEVQPHLRTQKTLEKPEMTDASLVPHM